MKGILPTTFRTPLLVSVLLVFVSVLVLLLQNLKSAADSNKWVEHTYEVLLQANKLSNTLNDCEIGNLRFLLSGQESRLSVYEAGLKELPRAQNEIHRLTRDNSKQQSRLKEMDALLAERLSVLAQRIDVRRKQGIEAAQLKFNTDKGLVMGKRIRAILGDVTAEEQNLLAERKAVATAKETRTIRLTIGGAAVLLALLSCLNYILERDFFLRIRAEEEVRKREVLFRGMFDNASVGIALLSSTGKFEIANMRFSEITGYTNSQLRERTLQSITCDGAILGSGLADTAAGPGAVYTRTQRCLRSDGNSTWVKLTASALPPEQDGSERLIGIIEDINAQVQAESALQAANSSLLRSNESLQQFAYVASHDLQEPLRTIAMFTELLARDANANNDERTAKFVGIIGESAGRMSKLIEALLQYSQASSDDHAGFQRVSMEELMTQTLESLRARIEEEQAVIRWDNLPVVYGDPIRLHQVLQNLIGNALKYRRPDLTPQIQIACERDAAEWVVRVKDNGLGFKPQYSEGIFTIFKRLHNREISGNGVGLAVVKTVVRGHGGRVWAESAGENEGATFSFTIPSDAA